MFKISKSSATVLVVLVCVVVVQGTKSYLEWSRKKAPFSTGKVKGNDNAPIRITEFIDFQCPACAGGAEYLKQTIEQYPQAVRLELKHYPLQMHPHGFLSSRYAECAARQGKFWPFQDLLLARQGNWQRLIDAAPAFEQIAAEVHLDIKELSACLEDEKVSKFIEKDKEEGTALGIRSTPTYFVNGKMVVGKKSLESEVSELLKAHGY